MVGAGHVVTIDVSEVVPSDAEAAVLSVTATASCVPGFLTVFACGARPPTSNINYEVGRTTAGLAITPMTDGKVCIFASNPTDVIVDVMGAFTPDGDRFHPMTPTRWIDTRGGASQLPDVTGARSAKQQTQVQMRGKGGVPQDATAVWLNLTVADPTSPTVLSAYPGPCDTPPLSSNVNARALRSTASSVMVGIGDDGSVCVLTYTGQSNIVIDVGGWFSPIVPPPRPGCSTLGSMAANRRPPRRRFTSTLCRCSTSLRSTAPPSALSRCDRADPRSSAR